MDKEVKRTEESNNMKWKIIGISIISAILIIYVGMAVFFHFHYYFRTNINDMNCSGMTPGAVTNKIIESIDTYDLKIEGRLDLEDHILGKEIDMLYQPDNGLDAILKEQNPWIWFLSIFKKYDYEYEKAATYNEVKLKDKIDSLVFLKPQNNIAPENAYITDYQEDKGFEIIPEEKGSTIDKYKLEKQITEAVKSADNDLDLDEAECYKQAAITATSTKLKKDCDTLNKCIQVTITYDFDFAQETINKEQIKDFITYQNNEIQFDTEKVRETINAIAKKYDTYGRNRKFKTMGGNEIELLSGGYGWRVDRAAETEQLIEDILNGKDVTREMIYSSRGYVRKANTEGGVDDIGDTYVEINLGAQHLYVVKDKEVVEEADFVSGKIINGNGTPPGVFGITYKEKEATLSGANYESHVHYWMPFNGNIGMHDATWRNKFGGDIYITNGSHGCINLPLEKAEEIYELVEKGMPVVCYY